MIFSLKHCLNDKNLIKVSLHSTQNWTLRHLNPRLYPYPISVSINYKFKKNTISYKSQLKFSSTCLYLYYLYNGTETLNISL